MKAKIIIVILFAIALLGNSSYADGIEFIHDKKFQELLTMAKAQNKLVFLDCYTSWCGPCKRLAANTFPDHAVGEFFNANFICSKFDMEKDEGLMVASKYEVRAYPTLLWIDGDGNVKHKMVGGLDPEGLLSEGKKAIDPTPGILAGMHQKYYAGQRDMDFLSQYLDLMNSAGVKNDSVFKEFLEKIVPADLGNKGYLQTIYNLTGDIKSPGMYDLVKYKKNIENVVGVEAYNSKINTIASNAAAAAPQSADKTLFQQAVTLVKNNKAPDRDEKILKLSMDYDANQGNWTEYDKNASKYVKKYGAKNLPLVNDIAWNYFLNINDLGAIKKATGWIFFAVNTDNKYSYNITYAYLLYKQNNLKEAEKACDYAILRAKAENITPTSANSLKTEIQKALKDTATK